MNFTDTSAGLKQLYEITDSLSPSRAGLCSRWVARGNELSHQRLKERLFRELLPLILHLRSLQPCQDRKDLLNGAANTQLMCLFDCCKKPWEPLRVCLKFGIMPCFFLFLQMSSRSVKFDVKWLKVCAESPWVSWWSCNQGVCWVI